MRPSAVVAVEKLIERGLHFRDALEPCAVALDAEVFVEKSAVQPFNDAVRLRPAHLGRAVLDLFELQAEFVGMLVRPAAELASIVGENHVDFRLLVLE